VSDVVKSHLRFASVAGEYATEEKESKENSGWSSKAGHKNLDSRMEFS